MESNNSNMGKTPEVSNSLRVLLVEDSEDDTFLIVRQLERADYAVQWERVDTERALRASLERQEWDLILADFFLPKFDAASAQVMVQASGRDVDAFLAKPFNCEELVRALNTLLSPCSSVGNRRFMVLKQSSAVLPHESSRRRTKIGSYS